MSDYTIKTMIRTKVHLKHTGSYPELVRDGLPGRWGQIMGKVIYAAIVITVLGVCTVYLVFCGKLIDNFLHTALGLTEPLIVGPIVGMGAFLTVVSWLPSLRKIAFLSLIGDGALLVAMIATMIYGAHFYELQPLESYPQFGIKTFLDFYGPVVFLFGIHMLVVPLQNEMEDKTLFEPTLDWSLVVVVISNTLFALFAFLLFNKDTTSPITDSLTNTYLGLNLIADVALIFDLTFTFTVIFVAGRDVVESSFFGSDMSPETYRTRCLVRSAMTGLCVLLAIVLHDDFGKLVNLISGLTMSGMCFVVPPILYLVNLWPVEFRRSLRYPWQRRYMLLVCGINVAIIGIGGFTAVYSTYEALKAIITK